MPYQIQLRRGTTAQNTAFTGAIGELTVDTQLNVLRVQDGSTAGGFPLVGTASTQTLTNKTLTAPVITGGLTIDTVSASGIVGIAGITTITNATQSTTAGTGALVVTGGHGVGGNLYVGGNTAIAGALTVGGANIKSFSIAMAAAMA
jgi:hypothetical protein